MNSSITTSKPAPKAGPKTTPRALAIATLEAAQDRGLNADDAIKEARAKVWAARWKAVLAGDDTMAAVWIQALALLGDKGAKRAVADLAAAAAKEARR
ncbi:hypothetical protein APR04_003772 [Promicromonospora umidemergens]|uniref:Uncharacterized protein n=1 Tax=Promicromonospora umidemergens TaxID=629679 RepID=A0ABP8XJA4_9MICO|nr:hypothetical protein [Promicromonospora umidemergens]MCP2284849.1 hypothetical protein [Promicromonospora umidemergens]